MKPKIKFDMPFEDRECKRCRKHFDATNYAKTRSPFFSQGYSDICNDCFKEFLVKNEFNWESVDLVCQYLNIPFVPKEFERLREQFGDDVFGSYADFFGQSEYELLNWKEYYNEFKRLKELGFINDELPIIQDKHKRELQEKWGFNYDDEALFYLEMLYEGLLRTQNISGALQMDQALKLCKISYELDAKIRAGDDIDKMISSYDKLVKVAEFTPKNVKNASDFDSVGELVKWLEKRGFKNSFYDNITRDIVDETMNNIQAYNRRLYTNESGIGEQITERIEGLKHIEQSESYYGINNMSSDELDQYDSNGYDELIHDLDDDNFNAEI